MARSGLLVIDAQNGYCHPYGDASWSLDCFEHTKITECIGRIKKFGIWVETRSIPIIYFCANGHLRDVRGVNWNTQVVAELRPPENYPLTFWKDYPGINYFYNQPFLDYIDQEKIEHFFVAGFYSHQCVTAFALEAMQRSVRLTILSDCVYPEFTPSLQEKFRDRVSQGYLNPKNHLVSFKAREDCVNELESQGG